MSRDWCTITNYMGNSNNNTKAALTKHEVPLFELSGAYLLMI